MSELKLSQDDLEILTACLVAAYSRSRSHFKWRFAELANRLNQANSNWKPYVIPLEERKAEGAGLG